MLPGTVLGGGKLQEQSRVDPPGLKVQVENTRWPPGLTSFAAVSSRLRCSAAVPCSSASDWWCASLRWGVRAQHSELDSGWECQPSRPAGLATLVGPN